MEDGGKKRERGKGDRVGPVVDSPGPLSLQTVASETEKGSIHPVVSHWPGVNS